MTLYQLSILLIFQLKHFIADYPLQGWPYTQWMLGKFKPKGWELPLAGHAAVHALCTLGIALYIRPELWSVCLWDFVVHFIMDRLKASPFALGRWKAICEHDLKYMKEWPYANHNQKWRRNAFFWWSLGLDQMVHHTTDLVIAWVLLS